MRSCVSSSNVVPPGEALTTLLDRLEVSVRGEVVSTARALGRIMAEDVVSPEDLPPYPRSTMDGYSVRARDTFGASESLPAFCEVVGEVAMGSQPQVSLSTGQTAVAYTGGMLAEGADAVVMVENTQRAGDGSIEILRPVAPGENVIQVGEDAKVGDTVIPKGRLIRAQDVGVLYGLGITEVAVAERPKVAIVSTGDELVPSGSHAGIRTGAGHQLVQCCSSCARCGGFADTHQSGAGRLRFAATGGGGRPGEGATFSYSPLAVRSAAGT